MCWWCTGSRWLRLPESFSRMANNSMRFQISRKSIDVSFPIRFVAVLLHWQRGWKSCFYAAPSTSLLSDMDLDCILALISAESYLVWMSGQLMTLLHPTAHSYINRLKRVRTFHKIKYRKDSYSNSKATCFLCQNGDRSHTILPDLSQLTLNRSDHKIGGILILLPR